MKKTFPQILALIACALLTACGAGNNCVGHNGCSDTAVATTTTPTTTTTTPITTTPTSATTYTIGGTISGLTSGSLVLQNNSGDNLTVSANSSSFTFATPYVSGPTYAVTVGTQPTGFTCSVTNGTGTVVSSIVTSVVVTCVANWIGTKQLGEATKSTSGVSVATDTSGNVYVAGSTAGGLDGNTLTGTQDFFVTKYNSSGVKQYTRQLGVATKFLEAFGVATDVSGNVYVAGGTPGGLDGNTLTGTNDFFVTKYDSSGVKQYTKQLGVAAATTVARSVTTDASGNVYVAGETRGGLDGNTYAGSSLDAFVTKYDSSGVKQFTKQLGIASKIVSIYSVTTDISGNVYVAGYTTGGLDGNTLTGTRDFFVTNYDSNGVKQFTKQLGVATKLTQGFGVATDASGSVFVAGETRGGLDGNTLTGTLDFFVTKYNSSGVKQ
jgi:hypothetical protein